MMMKYRVISKRKHFYACPICSLVYITAKALKTHYGSLHPSLPCEVVELQTDPLEDEVFEEFHANATSTTNYLYKEDLYSLPKAVLSVPTDTSVANVSAGPTLLKMDEYDYVPSSSLTPTKLITLTAPLDHTVSHQLAQLQTTSNITPIYSFKVEPTDILHQNGQIAKKTTIFADSQPQVQQILVQQTLQPQPQSTMPISIQAPVAVPVAVPVTLPMQLPTQVSVPAAAVAPAPRPTPAAVRLTPNNEKPAKKYNCSQCGKTFSTIYNKRRHDDMFHSNSSQTVNEFKCSSCDKVFSSIYNKTRHENVHKPINERLKYKCVIHNCNRGFTTQFILKMHIKKVHNMDVNF